jgi:hypothetical protein
MNFNQGFLHDVKRHDTKEDCMDNNKCKSPYGEYETPSGSLTNTVMSNDVAVDISRSVHPA